MSRSPSFNPRNAGVKRLMQELRELQSDPSPDCIAAPLEDDLFEWHFTVRGAADSPFEGGRYHGRLLFPPEYPFKPPNIILLTPNGRFGVGQKICLSMSAHHPELWQPSWSIRTVLYALIGFFPTPGNGAIGAIDLGADARIKLARESLEWSCPTCGSHNRTALPESSPSIEASTQQATPSDSSQPDANAQPLVALGATESNTEAPADTQTGSESVPTHQVVQPTNIASEVLTQESPVTHNVTLHDITFSISASPVPISNRMHIPATEKMPALDLDQDTGSANVPSELQENMPISEDSTSFPKDSGSASEIASTSDVNRDFLGGGSSSTNPPTSVGDKEPQEKPLRQVAGVGSLGAVPAPAHPASQTLMPSSFNPYHLVPPNLAHHYIPPHNTQSAILHAALRLGQMPLPPNMLHIQPPAHPNLVNPLANANVHINPPQAQLQPRTRPRTAMEENILALLITLVVLALAYLIATKITPKAP